MIAYQYKHGDRPLEGYVIERAAGRGGFGEVYYATSDSGREVALKAILGHEQIELRGISQCMNLKSPHLVTIFDVKYNEQGRPFVIMEYVNGPNLRELLDQSPAGLGEQKAAFFLREISKGLTFLHDCGIVHRDLKPANIFYENGYVKIGDYGLSKAIATNHHSGQTVTVGTVHYMAPEIGAGKYDRSIDIYALGACLYEMLTGTPPFIGASPSEVLMKHLSREPDCSGINEPFRTVIRKAMAKDPNQRYQNVQEMVESVFGADHIRHSVSVFSPMDLSMVAQQAAKKVSVAGGGGVATESSAAPAPPSGDSPNRHGRHAHHAGHQGQQLGEDIWQRLGKVVDPGIVGELQKFAAREAGEDAAAEAADPLSRGQRAALGLIAMVILAVAGGLFGSGRFVEPHTAIFFIWLAVAGGAVGTLVVARRLMQGLDREAPLIQRLAGGGSSFALALVVSGLAWGLNDFRSLPETWFAIALPLFVMNTYKWASPSRKQRVNFWEDAFLAGLFAWIAGMIFEGNGIIAAAVAGGIALVTQVAAPWDPRRAGRPEPARNAPAKGAPLGPVINGNIEINTLEQPIAAGTLIRGNAVVEAPDGHIPPGTRIEGNAVIRTPDGKLPPDVQVRGNATVQQLSWWKPVPTYVRWIWISLMILSFTLAMMFFVAAGMTYSNSDEGLFVAMGLGFLAGFVIFLIQSCRRRYYGKWSNFFKPLSLLLCLSSIFIAWTILAYEHLSSDETMAAVFFIVFPLSVGIVMLCISGRRPAQAKRIVPPPLPNRAPPATDRFDPGARTAPTQPWQSGSYSVIGSLPGLARKGVSGLVVLMICLLMLGSVLAGLSLALDVPMMLSAGVLDPALAQELNEQTFGNYPKWPQLINRITVSVMFILMVTAVIMLLIARRSSGVWHMLRGVVGAGGLLFALLPLAKATGGQFWPQVADAVHVQQNPAMALDLFLSAWHGPVLVLSLMILVASLVLLVWSPRKQKEPAAPMPALKEVAV